MDLEKVKKTLQKHFCFTQMQSNDVKKNGGQTMELEDMEYILSLEGITRKELFFFKSGIMENYDSKKLFKAIDKAKKNGLSGVILYTTLTNKDDSRIRDEGYFIEYAMHGWDEIYFSEEAFYKNKISSFQSLLGSFVSIASFL